MTKLQRTLFLGIFDNFRPSAGESENCCIEIFYINQLNIHRLTFMQKIKKIGPPKLDICTENAHFCDFWHFRHPEGEQPDFSVRQAMRQIKGLISL